MENHPTIGNTKRLMKRHLSIITLVMVTILFGCTSKGNAPEKEGGKARNDIPIDTALRTRFE